MGKVPNTHEPPIPDFVDTVVTVAGLSALGKTCTAGWVHRNETYSQLAGLQPGNPISIDAMKNVLSHSRGGLKNVPSCAEKVALLNQAGTLELCQSAERLANYLLPAFDRVVVAALNSKTDAPYKTGVYNSQEWK